MCLSTFVASFVIDDLQTIYVCTRILYVWMHILNYIILYIYCVYCIAEFTTYPHANVSDGALVTAIKL